MNHYGEREGRLLIWLGYDIELNCMNGNPSARLDMWQTVQNTKMKT